MHRWGTVVLFLLPKLRNIRHLGLIANNMVNMLDRQIVLGHMMDKQQSIGEASALTRTSPNYIVITVKMYDTLLVSALTRIRYLLNTILSLLMFVYISLLLTQFLNRL